MSSIFKTLRQGSKTIANALSASNIITAIKNFNFAGAFSPLKNIFSNINLIYDSVSKKITTAGGVTLATINRYIRRADLSGLIKRLGLNTKVSSSAEAAFKKASIVPDFKLRDIEVSYSSVRKSSNAKVFDAIITTPSGDYIATLTTKNVSKLDTICKRIKSLAGTATIVVGVIGGLYLLGDLVKNLVEASQKRRGCFLTYNVNGEVGNCKLPKRSCINNESDSLCDRDYAYNTICHVLSLANKGSYTQLKEIFGVDYDVTKDNIYDLIKTESSRLMFEEYANGLKESDLMNVEDVCAHMEGFDGDTIYCRACDVYADEYTPEYFDSDYLADNASLECVKSSSLLETIIDYGTSVGLDILSWFGNLLGLNSTTFKIILYICLGIIAAFIIFKIVGALNKKRV